MLRSWPGLGTLLLILFLFQSFCLPVHAMSTVESCKAKALAPLKQRARVSSHPLPAFKLGNFRVFKAKLSRFITIMLAPDELRKRKANRQARFGFVLSLLSLFVIPVLPAIPGIILCVAALSEEKKAAGTLSKNSKSFAEVGIVLGVLSFILLALILVIVTGMTNR